MSDFYKPDSLKEFRLHPKTITSLNIWLKNRESGKEKRNVLIQGPPGIGKTLLIKLFFKEKKYDLIEFIPKYTCTHKVEMKRLETCIMSSNIFSMIEDKKKAILFDNIDIGNSGDRGYINDIIQLCENSIKLNKIKNPSIFTISKPLKFKKLKKFKENTFFLELTKPSSYELFQIVQTINEKNHLEIDTLLLKEFSDKSFGDLRKIQQNIKLYISNSHNNKPKTTQSLISDKDPTFKPLYSIEKYLNPSINVNLDNIQKIYDADPIFSVANIYDNSWKIIEKIYCKNNKLKKYLKILNILGDWSLIDQFYSDPTIYSGYEFKSIIGLAYPMFHIRNLRDKYKYTNIPLKTSNLYSRISQSSFNWKSIKELCFLLKIGENEFHQYSYIIIKYLIEPKYNLENLANFLISNNINITNLDRIIRYNCISDVLEKKITSNRKMALRKLIYKVNEV